jgi:hypothetical protein
VFGGRVLTLLQFLNRKKKEVEWSSQDQSEHSEPFFKAKKKQLSGPIRCFLLCPIFSILLKIFEKEYSVTNSLFSEKHLSNLSLLPATWQCA